MGTWSASRILPAVCGVLLVLLAALAAVQYRWSTRVAAAEAQRGKEHLEAGASLFASRFHNAVAEAVQFLQRDAYDALRSGNGLTGLPKVAGEVYFLDAPAKGEKRVQRLAAGGRFEPAQLPEAIAIDHCAAPAMVETAAFIAPIYQVDENESRGSDGVRVRRTLRWRTDRCFVARLDQTYLREMLFPQLIRQSFGETAAREYDFAIVSSRRPDQVFYGMPLRADLRKPFFTGGPILPPLSRDPLSSGQPGMLVQRVETLVRRGAGDLHGPGSWELQIAHKGVPLAAAFERNRKRDLLVSLAVELFLAASIVFLVIGAVRMQRLADQKMRFVAGVSHELRSPVSAIAMLARNQADGLVAGADKVKQYGELIHQQARRLNEMVEQTLQYAGIHSGLRKPVKNEIDLAGLIQDAVEARREELASGGFEIEIAVAPDLPRVVGDAKLLASALDNLLDNALKHGGAGRWIRLSAGHTAAEKEVRISLEDRGAGIDPADQAEIFEPFCRGRAAVEAQIPGSGLGLSLVRSAAAAHRGSVTLVSEPGRGSTFTMRLPV